MDSRSVTSLSLLERVKRRDSESWTILVRLYTPLVYAILRNQGLQPADAEDGAQNVMFKVAEVINRYEHTGSFRGWLATVARTQAIDILRKKQREVAADGGSDHRVRMEAVATRQSFDEEISRWLKPGGPAEDPLLVRALELLKSEFEPETVRAFWRMHIDGNSAEMVARELGWHDALAPQKGANRVRRARFRVHTRLKQEFTGLNEFPPGE